MYACLKLFVSKRRVEGGWRKAEIRTGWRRKQGLGISINRICASMPSWRAAWHSWPAGELPLHYRKFDAAAAATSTTSTTVTAGGGK
jgi:hypothetical protein